MTAAIDRSTRQRTIDAVPLLMIAMLPFLYLLIRDIPLGHDQNWYLIAVTKLLGGARVYEDIVEINPPLIFYIMTPPVALARLFGANPQHMFVAFFLVLSGISLCAVRAILLAANTRVRVLANGAMIGALIGVAAISIFDFGQRDVLMIVFALPYLALTVSRIEGGSTRQGHAALIGVWAALGFALKPYFLLIPLASEIAIFIHRRNGRLLIRTENLTIAIVIVAYITSSIALHPAYFDIVVPMARATYFAYSSDGLQSLTRVEFLIFPLSAISYFLVRRNSNYTALLDLLLFWSIAASLIYFVQNKGFSYHIEPLRFFLILLSIATTFTRGNDDRYASLSHGCAAVFLVFWAIWSGTYSSPASDVFTPHIKKSVAKEGVYTLTAHLFIGFPLTNSLNAPWNSRFPALWPVPGAARILASPKNFSHANLAAAQAALNYVSDAVVEDFERQPPGIVLVDARNEKSYFNGVSFDFIAWLSENAQFATQWQHYDRVYSSNGFEVWERQHNRP